jgi:hypothetical protein
MPEIPREVI